MALWLTTRIRELEAMSARKFRNKKRLNGEILNIRIIIYTSSSTKGISRIKSPNNLIKLGEILE